jgi:peptide/nickel transport system ATP-binding protein
MSSQPVAPLRRDAEQTSQVDRDVVLSVRDLQVHYETLYGPVKAVNRVSFDLRKREILGLVGESGSGKTTMAMALVGLIRPPGHIAGGEIWLDDRNLAQLTRREYNRVRLSEIALMPQGAMNSLNPVIRIREQLIDGLRDHGVTMPRNQANRFLSELLERVGLRPEVADMYPHELSGGMKQRVAMAIAISMQPKVIIADEPTSALDVVVQKRVMQTLQDVQDELGASIILVGHDMGLMAQTVDRLGVMYAGRLVEVAPMTEALLAPQHPYTRLLIESLPSVTEKKELRGIPGLAPHLLELPGGCPFHPRCPHRLELCETDLPAYREVRRGHWAACHLSEAEQREDALQIQDAA